MGVLHKLIKRRDIEGQKLGMNLASSMHKVSKHFHSIEVAEEDLATDDNQFTAEHIVQLCKFLAEKSKQNLTQHKRLSCSPDKCKNYTESSRKTLPGHQSASIPTHLECSVLMATAQNSSQILKRKFPSQRNIQDNHRMLIESQKCHNSTQDKREILLKIRHQILERKRLRQLEEQHLDVWRPW